MALRAAARVKDGGTLQIGIGSFSDALAHALILRHANNAAFCDLLDRLGQRALPTATISVPFRRVSTVARRCWSTVPRLAAGRILCRRVARPNGGQAVLHAGFFVGSQAFLSGAQADVARRAGREFV
jgi:hypothetical protein